MNAKQPRYALITGAAGGIGRALVHEFAANDYAVIATDQTAQPADLACAHYLQADLARTVSDEDYGNGVLAQVKAIVGTHGLHALINNAAIQILGGADSLTRADWLQTLHVNLLAPFFWAQALLPEVEAAKGSIVNVSSIHARLTKKNFVAYATSKAALSGMTRAMAVDLGKRIRVNAIEPAAIATPMLMAGFEIQPSLFAQLEQCNPQQRIGQPDEVAKLALAIVAGGMEFLHGTCIGLDGGISGRLFDPV